MPHFFSVAYDCDIMWSFLVLASLAMDLVSASSKLEYKGLQYQNLRTRAENLPLLKLPYGTWQASKYDKATDVRLDLVFRMSRRNPSADD
jgi:hypothetical protein